MFGLSLLQLWWSLVLARAVYWFFWIFATGKWLVKNNRSDPDAPLRYLQFRKRLALWYFCGLLFTVWITWNLVWTCLGWSPGERFLSALVYFTGNEAARTDSLHVMIAMCLWLFHLGRRYYESLSISIFSGRQVLDPVTAFQLFLNQLVTPLTIMADMSPIQDGFSCLALASLTWRPFIAVPLFLWASKLQHQCHRKLANLRRNRAGHVVTSAHKLPKGGWFDRVWCPHYFAELMIFLAMGLLLGPGAFSWWMLTLSTTLILLILANSTHNLYQQSFKDNFPQGKKIMIPYIF